MTYCQNRIFVHSPFPCGAIQFILPKQKFTHLQRTTEFIQLLCTAATFSSACRFTLCPMYVEYAFFAWMEHFSNAPQREKKNALGNTEISDAQRCLFSVCFEYFEHRLRTDRIGIRYVCRTVQFSL